jgi:hypothetical protein
MPRPKQKELQGHRFIYDPADHSMWLIDSWFTLRQKVYTNIVNNSINIKQFNN